MNANKDIVKGAIVAGVIALVATTSGCSNNNEENELPEADNEGFGPVEEEEEDENENDLEEQGDVTLTYARGYDATGANEELIAAFEEEHPNINVEFLEMPTNTTESRERYLEMFTEEEDAVDVFDADIAWTAEMAHEGYALELDPFIEEDDEMEINDYFDGSLEAGQYDESQWALPKNLDTGLLYYRSDLVEDPPETWEELIDEADEHTGEDGPEFGYVMQADQYEGLVVNALEFIHGYGGEVVDENNNVTIHSDETIEALEKMIEVMETVTLPDNITNYDESDTHNTFTNGDAVFARNWSYMQGMTEDEDISEVTGDTEIAPLPSEPGETAAVLGGWMTMISSETDYPEEAWELMTFIAGEEGQQITAVEGGEAPTLEELYDNDDILGAVPLFAEDEFVETLEEASPRITSPAYTEISNIMQVEIYEAVIGDQTVEEAVLNMEAELESLIDP